MSDTEMDTNEHTLFYKKGLCGLTNLGNTCFMNSIIQCINSNRDFVKLFLSELYKQDLNTEKKDALLVEQWAILSKGLYNKNAVVSPSLFHRYVQALATQKGYNTFSGFGQNDSQEFLQFLLETIHNGLSKSVSMNITGDPENELDKMALCALTNWKAFFKNDYSPIIKMFYGQLVSKIETTDDIDFRSNTYDPYSNLSLEIPSIHDRTISIYDCLDVFTQKETLDEFKQDSEDTKQYTRKINLWTTPDYLVLFFKRFTKFGEKKEDFIDFPLEGLDLSSYCVGYDSEHSLYDLHAVSNHSGGLMGGHYWAYTKNYDHLWYKYDDKFVSLKHIDNVVTKNAYCLFYKKRI